MLSIFWLLSVISQELFDVFYIATGKLKDTQAMLTVREQQCAQTEAMWFFRFGGICSLHSYVATVVLFITLYVGLAYMKLVMHSFLSLRKGFETRLPMYQCKGSVLLAGQVQTFKPFSIFCPLLTLVLQQHQGSLLGKPNGQCSVRVDDKPFLFYCLPRRFQA